jgi:hypothetical protein
MFSFDFLAMPAKFFGTCGSSLFDKSYYVIIKRIS